MRRPNGTGSVYKKKGNRRKPYIVEVTLGYDHNGKRKSKTIGTFEKRTDAWKALDEYFGNPELFDAKKITFGDCWNKMEQAKANLGISIKTYSIAKTRCEHIWNKPIQSLRLFDLQNIIDKADVKPASKKTIKVALKAVYSLAYENDYIEKNYAELIKLPTIGNSDLHEPFTIDEIKTLWQHTDDDAVKVILIYIYTGARPIELLKMQWDTVNLEEQYMIGGVKTEAGKNRHIPIADCILPFMEYFKTKHSDSLFGFKSNFTIRDRLSYLSKTYGIGKHLPHDMRHTFVTLANTYDLKQVIVKRIIGHSRGTNVTESVYTHTTHQQHLNEVNKLPFGNNFN